MADHVCLHCGKPFTSKWRNSKGKFCSRPCAHAYRREQGTETGVCLHCGKEFEYRRYKRRKYCSADCAGRHTAPQRNKQVDCVCVECGSVFRTPPSQVRPLCSAECQERQYQRARIERKCEQCGTWFTSKRSDNRRFCSHACYAKSLEKPDVRSCKHCGKPFVCRPCEPMQYCSTDCRSAAQRIEGSHAGYGPDWPVIRDEIRRRDGYCCVRCGVPENGRAHDVHHIVPLRTFNGNLVAAHHPSNLITLCRSCHTLVEQGAQPLQLSLAATW